MVGLQGSGSAVFRQRHLGSHARARHPAPHPLLPGHRIRIRYPRRNLQIKVTKRLSNTNDFVAYIDAIGHLDGTRCLLEWKTTSTRYPEEPQGLLMLDPQLVCYSWITGIADVAQVVFVRKRLAEIQYFRTTITE